MRKFDNVSARLNFSPQYFSTAVKKTMKPVVLIYHEAINIFLGSKNVLNLVSDPPVTCQWRYPLGLNLLTCGLPDGNLWSSNKVEFNKIYPY